MHQNMPMCPFSQQMMSSMPMMEMDKTMPMMAMMPIVPMLIELDEDEDEMNIERAKADDILDKIEKNDPQIFAIMRAYGIPMLVARRIVRRIIRLTMMYSK